MMSDMPRRRRGRLTFFWGITAWNKKADADLQVKSVFAHFGEDVMPVALQLSDSGTIFHVTVRIS